MSTFSPSKDDEVERCSQQLNAVCCLWQAAGGATALDNYGKDAREGFYWLLTDLVFQLHMAFPDTDKEGDDA